MRKKLFNPIKAASKIDRTPVSCYTRRLGVNVADVGVGMGYVSRLFDWNTSLSNAQA